MPRPPKYTEQIKLKVYAMKRANPEWGHARITAELRKSFGRETPSDRTVSRFLQTISSAETTLANLRTPWRAWQDDDKELREATPYLLSVVGAIQSLEVFPVERAPHYNLFSLGLWDSVAGADPRENPSAKIPELTLLEAHWVARIHSAAPELSLHDTFWTAQDIVTRERVHRILEPEQPFECGDLHFLLAIKPWLNNSRYRRYLRLVRSGRVPQYRFTALADIDAVQPPVPDGIFQSSDETQTTTRASVPIPGDYSMISLFVERQCRGLELVRRRALRNDFGFFRSWRHVTRTSVSPRLPKTRSAQKRPSRVS